MIVQAFQQDGLLAATPGNPLFPLMADIVLVFFPSPGIFVRNTLSVPDAFEVQSCTYYEADAEPFEDMYVFLPAVLQRQYDEGKNQHGIVYEKEVLKFEPELIQALSEQAPKVIEHRLG